MFRAAHDVSNSLPKGDSQKKARMEEALDIIKIALSLDENNSDAQRWCGTIISNYGDFLSTKEQIANSYIIKSHWEKVIYNTISSSQYLSFYIILYQTFLLFL